MIFQHGVRRLPIRMRIEIQNDAVPQDRWRHRAHIFDAQMQPPAHKGQHAAALDQSLRSARRAAVADVFLGQLGRFSSDPAGSP